MSTRQLKFVTIGGGSGQSRLLEGLRIIPNALITGVCGMTDSGGSTAKIARAYKLSNCIGDVTKCMLGLCPYPEWKEKFLWRFGYPGLSEYETNLQNHSLKNLLFAGLEKQLGLTGAIDFMCEVMRIYPNRVLPISLSNSTLCARLQNGKIEIKGESFIDTISHNPLWDPDLHALEELYLSPSINIYKETRSAIEEADYVIFSPGDLFTSLIPNLLVNGASKALQKTSARLVLMPNLMTKPGETDRFSLTDMVKWAERYVGRQLDYILGNNASVPNRLLKKYRVEHKSELVMGGSSQGREVLLMDLLDTSESNIRHSPAKIAKAITELVQR